MMFNIRSPSFIKCRGVCSLQHILNLKKIINQTRVCFKKGNTIMKRFYNDYLYDTDNSKLIAENCAPCSSFDDRYYREALYQTPEGEFFLVGRGGAMSKYSQLFNGCSTGGSALNPLSIGEAEDWYREQLDQVYTGYDITKAKDPDPNYNTFRRLFKD